MEGIHTLRSSPHGWVHDVPRMGNRHLGPDDYRIPGQADKGLAENYAIH